MPLLKTAIAACVIELNTSDNAIQLFPAGKFDAPRGSLKGCGPWQLNQASAQKLIAAVAQRSNDILIDYEHQSLQTSQNGLPAPAAGWLKPDSLMWAETGLFANNPDWKDKAATMIANDEYRYLSPVFTYDSKTGDVLDILSVGLTNNPAIDGMSAVSLAAAITSYSTLQETPVDELMERLRYLLNLPLTTTPEEMLTELDKLKAMLSTDTSTAATSLINVLSNKNTEIAALKSQSPDPSKFVPIEAFIAVQQAGQVNAQANQDQQVAALIAKYHDVIIPALEPWATQLGKQDFSALQQYIATAKPIAAVTINQTQGKPPVNNEASALTGEEIAVCKQMGLSHEQFLANKGTGL
jgi:phage I-like protein